MLSKPYVTEQLLTEGAFEVFVTGVYMKKNTPGNLITVLCSEENEDQLVRSIFHLTSTLGIRETVKNRFILERNIYETETEYGTVRRKESSGYGITRSKYEYDDLARIAKENGASLKEAERLLKGK